MAMGMGMGMGGLKVLSIKKGVKLGGLQSEILLAVVAVERIMDTLRLPCVVTSGHDTTLHKTDSLHYKGLAVDIRLPSFYNPAPDLDSHVVESIRNALGEEYDVILEPNHIHIEFDPKPIKLTSET